MKKHTPTEDSGEYLPLAEDTDVARLRANVSFLWHRLAEIGKYVDESPDCVFSRFVVSEIARDRLERIDEEDGVLVVVPQRGGN